MLAKYISYAESVCSSCVDREKLMGIVHAAVAQLGRSTCRCSLEQQAGKATVVHRGGLVPAGGQRAARQHGPGLARAAALPRAQA